MKKLLLSILLCTLFTSIFAQSNITISGIVADSVSNKKLDLVTVSLLNSDTKQPVKTLLSDESGAFKIAAIAAPYQLTISSIGYHTRVINLGRSNADVDLGKILLIAASNSLKEVSILGSKPIIKKEIDRISYNVQNDPDVNSLSALEVMQKVPLLSVDANNAISLKGNKNFKILINNRESAMMASRPEVILKAMPAGSIEKIEVITTPPSKYDAEGLAGIINITLKKNATEGYNFSTQLNYHSVWGHELSATGAVKYKKLGVSVRSGWGYQRNQVNTAGKEQYFTGTNNSIVQNTAFSYGGLFHGSGVEVTYEADSLNLINVWGELSGNIYNENFDQTLKQYNSSNVTAGYDLLSDGGWTSVASGAGLVYQLNGAKNKDRIFSVAYKYVYLPGTQLINNTYADQYGNAQSAMPDYKQNNESGSRENTVQADYVYPLKRATFELGGKAIWRNNYSNYLLAQKQGNDYVNDDLQSNNFRYQQKIYALYYTYQLKLNKWAAKAGLRFEHTGIYGFFIPAATTINNKYSNLVPAVSIQRSFDNSSFTLGYTQRIARPGMDQINPFVNRVNPLFISLGNPMLRPELNNLIELTYNNTNKNPLIIGLTYAFSNNAMQRISYLDNTGTEMVTISSYNNSATNKSISLNANYTYNPNKDFTIIMNGLVSRVKRTGSNNFQDLSNSGYTGNVSANFSYKLGKGYRMTADTNFNSGNVNLQGKSNLSFSSALRVSKECFNKNGTLTLVAANIFARYYYYRDTTNTNDYTQTTFSQNPYRAFVLKFNYKIDKLKNEIKKSRQRINNDDIKG